MHKGSLSWGDSLGARSDEGMKPGVEVYIRKLGSLRGVEESRD